MLSVTCKPFMLNVLMLNVVMLIVVMLSIVAPVLVLGNFVRLVKYLLA